MRGSPASAGLNAMSDFSYNHWTEEEKADLRKAVETGLRIDQMCALFPGRTESGIAGQIKRLGLVGGIERALGVLCPSCGNNTHSVVDSRGFGGGQRRRRICSCGFRFTTFELVGRPPIAGRNSWEVGVRS